MAAAGRSTRADGGTGLVARPRSVPGWSHGHPLRRAARQPDRQVRQGNFSIQVSTLPRPFQRNPSNTPGRPTEKPQKSAVTPDTTRRAQLAPPDRPTVQTFPAQSVQIAPDRARPTGTRISAPQNIHQALDRIGHGPADRDRLQPQPRCNRAATIKALIYIYINQWLHGCSDTHTHIRATVHTRAPMRITRGDAAQPRNRAANFNDVNGLPVAERLQLGCTCNRAPKPA